MKTVLVTGPIGGGKSTVCRKLEARGYPVYDCDSRCKALYESVPGLKTDIERELGIPFAELGRIFADVSLRAKLEAMVYPLLAADLIDWKERQTAELAFVESAIMLQKPVFDGLYDSVLLVTAGRARRVARNPRAAERDSLQSFDPEKIDYTIRNSSTTEALDKNMDKFLKGL